MNRASIGRFAKRTAASIQQSWGRPISYEGGTYCATLGALSLDRELTSGDWAVDVVAVVRVTKAQRGFIPVDGNIITFTETGERYRITQIRPNPGGADHVLGVSNPENAA